MVPHWLTETLVIPQAYLRTGLMVSLLSVWLLVVLFFYLNCYTRRRYFAIWNVAWLFYAVWLTLGLNVHNGEATTLVLLLKQWSLNCTAVFLLWGSANFLKIKTNQRLFALFTGFLFTWSYVGLYHIKTFLPASFPVFGLIGMASILTSAAFFKFRRHSPSVGAGLLAFGFFVWGAYLIVHPFIAGNEELLVAGFFLAAVLQLLIAVSMIVLVLEEARDTHAQAVEKVRSVTHEKNELNTLVQSTEARYQCLFEQASDGIVLVNQADLRILELNPAAKRLLGLDPAAVVTEPISHFLPVATGKIDAAAWFAIAAGLPQVTVRRLNGSPVTIELAFSAIDLGGTPARQLVLRELTERVRLQQQLRQAEKLSALGRMVSGVAHELNNPLAIMKGYLELILNRDEFPERSKQDLRKVLAEGDRAGRLVHSFLSLAREPEHRRQNLDLKRLIEDTIENQKLVLPNPDLLITLRLDPHLPPISADASQVERVIINLYRNAVQATASVRPTPRLRITSQRRGEIARLIVEDNGPGVPALLVNKIFEPFFTTKDVGEGTGLGLSVSHQIVADHHGRMMYEPSELGGAAFVVELPLIAFSRDGGPGNCPPEMESGAPISTNSNSPRARILLLDDEVSLAEMLAEYLGLSGYETEICSSAASALSLVKEKHFDLVISDFRMPAMNGEQFLKLLTLQNPEMASRVIFVTGDTVGLEADQFFKNNPVRCLTKPYTLASIQAVVAECLDNLHNPETLAR